jgi:hypothetical protein
MSVDILISITILSFLAGCSWFNHDEKIDVENPKPGTEIDIKSIPEIKK